MPAKSEKQRKLMAIALHDPGKLYGRNRRVLDMSTEDLRDFSKRPRTYAEHVRKLRKGG